MNDSLNSWDVPAMTKRRRACSLMLGLASGSANGGVDGIGVEIGVELVFAPVIGKQHSTLAYSVSELFSLWRVCVRALSSMSPCSWVFLASWELRCQLVMGEGCALLLGGCAVHDCGGSGRKDRIAGRDVRKKRLWVCDWKRG